MNAKDSSSQLDKVENESSDSGGGYRPRQTERSVRSDNLEPHVSAADAPNAGDWPAPEDQTWLHETLKLLSMFYFGILANYARVGLLRLTAFEWGGVLWANIAGCVVMGFHPYILTDAQTPVIASGFCGSLTSFSSMILTLFVYSTTPTPSWGNNAYGIMQFLAYLFVSLECSLASFKFGQQLGEFARPYDIVCSDMWFMWCYAVLGVIVWVVSLVLSIVVPAARPWTLAAVFAPPGIWLRYRLARLNRQDGSQLKIGTGLVNFIGTLLACIFTLLSDRRISHTHLQVDVLDALVNGLCGSMTTVSTFAAELHALPLKHAYLYCIVSVSVGFALAIVINGSYKWA